MSAFILLLMLAAGDSVVVTGAATAFDVDLYGRIVTVDGPTAMLTLYAPGGRAEATAGGRGWGDTEFDAPAAVWMKNGIDIFVADRDNHRIQRFDRHLNFISSLSTRDRIDPEERFGYPSDVTLSRLGDLYVCDTENARVLKFDRSYRVDRSFGGLSAGRGRLHHPSQIEIGPGDCIYVLDDGAVIVFDSFGNFLRTIGDHAEGDTAAISADDDGLAVLRNGTVVIYDRNDRPVGELNARAAVGEGESVNGLVVHGSALYLLTDRGVRLLPGVRPTGE
jgi:tripartite motif-containing protein 71